MTNCEQLSDRMAVVARGGPVWTTEEAAHLATCAECSAEWRLLQAATRLGESSASRIDPTSVSRMVLSRLAARRRRQRAGWVGLLAAAAAVTMIVWSERPRTESETVATVATNVEFHLRLAELEGLDSLQLQSVLDGLDTPIGAGATSDAPALGDLKNSELEWVLRSLEG
jgi:hypothetical protein